MKETTTLDRMLDRRYAHPTRRRLLGAVTAGLLGAAAAACGSRRQEPAVQPAQETVKIVYWSGHTGGTAEAQLELAKRFNASQTSVQLDVQYQGSYAQIQQKVITSQAAATLPDTFLMEESWRHFWLNGMLEPLDKYVRQTKLDVDDFVGPLYQEGIRNGKLWVMSAARSTPLFYYNKLAWREANLPERAPETWDQLVEWGRRLVRKEGDRVVRHAFQSRTSLWTSMAAIWQFGGRLSDDSFKVTVAEPPAARAAQFLADLVHRQQIARADSAGTAQDQLVFTSGQSTSLIVSTSQLFGIQRAASFPVGAGFLPKQTQFGVPIGGSVLCMPKDIPEQRKAAAFEWLRFATSRPSTIYWAQHTGYMPVRKSAAQSPEMQTFYAENPNFKVAFDQLARARQCDPAYAVPPAKDRMEKAMATIIVENQPAAVVFRDLVGPLEAELAPYVQLLKTMK